MSSAKNTVVYRHNFIEAYEWIDSAQADRVFEILVSPIIEETDSCYEPVNEYLASHCVRRTRLEEWDTAKFFWSMCVYSQFQVYAVCPGPNVDHICEPARRGHVLDQGEEEVIGG